MYFLQNDIHQFRKLRQILKFYIYIYTYKKKETRTWDEFLFECLLVFLNSCYSGFCESSFPILIFNWEPRRQVSNCFVWNNFTLILYRYVKNEERRKNLNSFNKKLITERRLWQLQKYNTISSLHSTSVTRVYVKILA